MKKVIASLVLVCSLIGTVAASTASDAAMRLASDDIIVFHADEASYRMGDLILRQEVVALTLNMLELSLPEEYNCKGYYGDLSNTSPNEWSCRAIELAADSGIVSRDNLLFRPEDYITRSEALAILSGASTTTSVPFSLFTYESYARAWQRQVVASAYAHGIVDSTSEFGVNEYATRGEIFVWADRIRYPDFRLVR